jgi:hypothetical protein
MGLGAQPSTTHLPHAWTALAQVHYLGPPLPPCESTRLATARALGRIDDPMEDPEITK